MSKLLARWIINAIAIGAAVKLVQGIEAADIKTVLVVALIFGLVNALVRPILKALTCPLILLTLGLFVFVINAVMLLLTSAIAERLGLAFEVQGFIPALVGSLVISVVSIVLSLFVAD